VAIFSADDQGSAMAKAATASDSGGVHREVFRHHVGVNRVRECSPRPSSPDSASIGAQWQSSPHPRHCRVGRLRSTCWAGILVLIGIALFLITMLINEQAGVRGPGITDPTHLAEAPD
jgi:hypothetical protein